jgi:hypothetical protein
MNTNVIDAVADGDDDDDKDDDNDDDSDDDDNRNDDGDGKSNAKETVKPKTDKKKCISTSSNAHICSQNNIRHDAYSKQLYEAVYNLTKAESEIQRVEAKKLKLARKINEHHQTLLEHLPNLTSFNEQLSKLIIFVQMSYPGYETYKEYLTDKKGTNSKFKNPEEFQKLNLTKRFRVFDAMKVYYHKAPRR